MWAGILHALREYPLLINYKTPAPENAKTVSMGCNPDHMTPGKNRYS